MNSLAVQENRREIRRGQMDNISDAWFNLAKNAGHVHAALHGALGGLSREIAPDAHTPVAQEEHAFIKIIRPVCTLTRDVPSVQAEICSHGSRSFLAYFMLWQRKPAQVAKAAPVVQHPVIGSTLSQAIPLSISIQLSS